MNHCSCFPQHAHYQAIPSIKPATFSSHITTSGIRDSTPTTIGDNYSNRCNRMRAIITNYRDFPNTMADTSRETGNPNSGRQLNCPAIRPVGKNPGTHHGPEDCIRHTRKVKTASGNTTLWQRPIKSGSIIWPDYPAPAAA